MSKRHILLATTIVAAIVSTLTPLQAADLDADFAAATSYEFTQSRKAIANIEEAARNADAAGRKAIEGRLIKALASDKATAASKQWACRMLRRIGTDQSVATLAKLLADKNTSHMARWALQGMGSPAAGAALRSALASLSGDLKIGVIASLGRRRDPKAVDALAKLAVGGDKATADAALSALGMIATGPAAKALAAAKVPAALEARRTDSYLMCADGLAESGKTADAADIYQTVLDNPKAGVARVAALRGVVLTGKGRAADAIAELLTDDNRALRRAAGMFIVEMPGTEATKAFAAKLPGLPPKAQLVVIGALTSRGDSAASEALIKASASSDQAVSNAAIGALGAIGDGQAVPTLADQAVGDKDPQKKTAYDALLRIKGSGADGAIGKLLSDKNEKTRLLAADILGRRGKLGAVAVLVKAVQSDSSPDVRKKAFEALRRHALAGNVPVAAMVDLLAGASDDAQRTEAEVAVIAAATRTADRQGQAKPVLAALAKAKSSKLKASLVRVLGGIGDNTALAALNGAIADSDADVKLAGIRAAAAWPMAGTAEICLKIAQTSSDKTHHVLALRGYVKQAGLADVSDVGIVEMYAKAITAAQRKEEKILALSELANVRHSSALALAKKYASDPALKTAANAAVAKIDAAMRAPATATASHDSGNAKLAMDNNAGTRWTSGGAMKGGEWFQIDMGGSRIISAIVLDTQGSKGDYPRGYEVYISRNSRSKGTLVAKGKGTNWKTDIKFKPTTGRYIKIVQTGRTQGLNWSIHKMEITAKPE